MALPPKPPVNPGALFQQYFGAGAPGANYDWTALIQQWLDPYQRMYDEQMAAAEAAASQQRELAQSNAGLDSQQMEILHKKAIYDIKNSMGSRLLTDSGENHYQINKENKLYQIGMKKGANALQSYLENLSNSLASQRLAGLQALQQQRLGLLSQLPQLYPSGPGAGTPWWFQQSGTAPAPSGPPSWLAGTTSYGS